MHRQILVVTVAALTACAAQPTTSSDAPSEASANGAVEGAIAPELKLAARAGDEIDLSELRGKVVVVDFWASWCDPCKEELPVLERMYAKHQEKGLVVLAVNIDEEREAADDLLEQIPVSFPVLYDPEQETVSTWAPPKMPTSYIIDRDGKISVVQAGFKPEEAEELEAKVVGHL